MKIKQNDFAAKWAKKYNWKQILNDDISYHLYHDKK